MYTSSLAKLAMTFDRLTLLLIGDSGSWISPPAGPGRAFNFASSKGIVVGIVANRRAKDDRLEIWLANGGSERGTRLAIDWMKSARTALARELEISEVSRRFGDIWTRH